MIQKSIRPTGSHKGCPINRFRIYSYTKNPQPMKISCSSLMSVFGAVMAILRLESAEPVRLETLKDRIRVTISGKHFTDYVFGDGASRPFCHPILAADGTPLTRDFPMAKTDGEETDHPWHRSMWFAHSFMNGVDFWNEAGGDIGRSPKDKGRSEHIEILEARSGETGRLATRNRWMAPDGREICTDERVLEFGGDDQARWIDWRVTLMAPSDRLLMLGDNKDGTMAVRVAQWMTAPHRSGGVERGGQGQIVTSRDHFGLAAWGKRAEWCDYYAAHNGKTYGIALFDHPDNLRHPTWWMVRPYGLFAANPFGQHDFENLKDEPHRGDHSIPAGGKLTLQYRFLFHTGNPKEADVAKRYKEYRSKR